MQYGVQQRTFSKEAARAELQQLIDQCVAGKNDLRVLDAGCGGATRIKLPTDTEVTGIDISPDSVSRNPNIKQIILGDIQTYEFPEASFDVIVCWEVLEHVSDPQMALSMLLRAVKQDGIIVLAVPNVRSLKGLVTKFTPHWFHVWFLRTFLNDKSAGTPGFAPFRTYLRWTLAPNSIVNYSHEQGADVLYFRAYIGARISAMKMRFWIGYCTYVALLKVLSVFFLGARDLALSDMYVVLKRRPRSC